MIVDLRENVSCAVLSVILLVRRVFCSAEALAKQLVQHVVPADKVAEFVMHHANQICDSTSPQAVSKVKEMMRALSAMSRDQALDYAAKQNAVARASEDCRRGIDAFLNKEPLKWR